MNIAGEREWGCNAAFMRQESTRVRHVMQRAYDSGRHARRGLFRVVDDVRVCVDRDLCTRSSRTWRSWPISCFTYIGDGLMRGSRLSELDPRYAAATRGTGQSRLAFSRGKGEMKCFVGKFLAIDTEAARTLSSSMQGI